MIQAALNWAVGAGWIDRNPLRGFSINRDEGVRRPIVSADEYQKLLAVADRVGKDCRLALVLAHETGHRIGAIRLLRWSDVDLERATIRWRAENDKIGFEHTTPLTAEAVAELRAAWQQAPGIGAAWLFPAPKDTARPVDRFLVREWWKRLEGACRARSDSRAGLACASDDSSPQSSSTRRPGTSASWAAGSRCTRSSNATSGPTKERCVRPWLPAASSRSGEQRTH